jgi:hypothetical protein
MAHAHVSYGPGPICHKVSEHWRQERDHTTQSQPYSEDGCISYLRPRALTLSTDYFSPEIYGKGSEPGRFAQFAHFRMRQAKPGKGGCTS